MNTVLSDQKLPNCPTWILSPVNMSSTGIGPGTFERLSPSRFVSFAFPNPLADPYADSLRIAVLDSPLPTQLSKIAAILVPRGREDDWIFSTDAGHLQLLLASSSPDLPLSRLILVGDLPVSSPSPAIYACPEPDIDPDRLQRFQQRLLPILLALSPKAAFRNGIPQIPFIAYEDDVVRSVLVERLAGPVAGEMLVEDVEIAGSTSTEHRRRLRFRRMPNLVQTQVRLLPDSSDARRMRPKVGSLVQPYIGPMAASLSLIAPHIEEKIGSGSRPRALCLGVGGGALLMFLHSNLGFDVVGVEADEVVSSIARRHFGLIEGEFLRVHVGDGIELIEHFARKVECHRRVSSELEDAGTDQRGVPGFDAIMVDLDSVDAMSGINAPPLEFVRKNVLIAARSVLNDIGLLVVNVFAPKGSFYNALVDAFREVFSELYELDVGNGENYVLIAATSALESVARVSGKSFTGKLKKAIGERYMECIKII